MTISKPTEVVAQTVKDLPAMWETWVQSLGREDLLEKGMATHSSILAPPPPKAAQRSILGFPDSSVGKESTCNTGDPGSIPGSGRSAGEGKRYPLQYSGLKNSMDSP